MVRTRSGGRIARVHRGGDGAVGHDAQIGQVELQAGFGIERDDVAFADPERPQAGRDLLGGRLVLVPGIDGIGAVGRGLAERGSVAVDARGLFENLVQSAGSHFMQFITARLHLTWRFCGCRAPRYTLTTGHGDWRMMA